MMLNNVGFKPAQSNPAPKWLTDMKGQVGRKAYWRGVGCYEITGVRDGGYLLGKGKIRVEPDKVRVL